MLVLELQAFIGRASDEFHHLSSIRSLLPQVKKEANSGRLYGILHTLVYLLFTAGFQAFLVAPGDGPRSHPYLITYKSTKGNRAIIALTPSSSTCDDADLLRPQGEFAPSGDDMGRHHASLPSVRPSP